jgi:hypothetical protein
MFSKSQDHDRSIDSENEGEKERQIASTTDYLHTLLMEFTVKQKTSRPRSIKSKEGKGFNPNSNPFPSSQEASRGSN